ncbi:tail fiber protein [Xenorhabdus cabanillasii]|uniref:Phage tail collar domain-containing protein n=1 Tax=Xenorhabdus cabanillasii JM26 TaxID=1427517 RepID=W1J5X3_9GAMM|nr:tail fiber protein [Xenorhabdus cabanillasii]PHM78860.1 hypothetical protein Xcab_00437 [Xenorhabdus cabanillasii JM26]CDL86124.1 conserved hypothetical protein [Xenorhabdus cabanillasii JM26]
MKELRYSEKTQKQQTLSDAKGVGPETDKLKDKFKEGSIPLQTDFNQLIDIADIGRRATGQAPDQNGPAKGMCLDKNGLLQLKLDENYDYNGKYSPLKLHNDVLVVGVGPGLTTYTGAHEIGIKGKVGLNVSDDGVSVKAANGIVVDDNGVSVKAGHGIQFSSDGALEVKAANKTITVNNSGIKVNISSGLTIFKEGTLGAKLQKNGALAFDNSGCIFVETGKGIKIDNDKVVIDPETVLPRGMIMMFSGSSVPKGWAFCDGSNGTPDLRNRFILGANTLSEQVSSSGTISGSGSNRTYDVTTNKSEVPVHIEIGDTTLYIEHMPAHSHQSGIYILDTSSNNSTWGMGGVCVDGKPFVPLSGTLDRPYSSTEGDSRGHNHTATVKPESTEHSHLVNVLPPYYTLAFIMKL